MYAVVPLLRASERALLSFVALGLSACAPADRVARVGGDTLSQSDYRAFVDEHAELRGQPPSTILDALVDETVAAARARRVGLHGEDAFVRTSRSDRRDLLASAYLRAHFAKELAVSDEAVRGAYERTAERRNLRHILLGEKTDADATVAALQAGADFGRLATERSIDEASARNGGNLGWVSVGSLDPTFVDRAFALGEGEISAPFKTQFGWHIVNCLGVEHADMSKLDERKRVELRLVLQRQAAEQQKAKAVELARGAVKVEELLGALEGDYSIQIDPADGKKAVARVGATEITMAELKGFMGDYFKMQSQSHVMGPAAKREFLAILEKVAILAEAAHREGLDRRQDIAAALDEHDRRLLAERLRGRTLPRASIEDRDVATWFATRPAELDPGPEVHLLFIIAADEAEAETAKAEIAGGTPFSEAARAYSRDETAAENGGDAGWLRLSAVEENLGVEAVELLTKASPGATVGPIATQFGVQLFQVVGRRPGAYPDIERDRDRVLAAFRAAKADDIWRAELARLRSEASVTLYPHHLANPPVAPPR